MLTTAPKTLQLSQRDLAMIRDIARYKFLDTFQLERLYFAAIKHRRYDPDDPSTETQRANARHRPPNTPSVNILTQLAPRYRQDGRHEPTLCLQMDQPLPAIWD